MIKIGVDGRLLQGNLTGVGKYVLYLIEYIATNISEIEISVYSNKNIPISFSSQKITLLRDKKAFSKVKPMIWSKFFSYKLINSDKPDIYLSGDTFVPLFLKVDKIISVVHDVAHIISPETMSSAHLAMARIFFKRDLLKATVIISNSYGTADKVKKYFKRDTDLVIYPIIDRAFNKVGNEETNGTFSTLKISYPYILSVATYEPRKNLDKTIKAFISLKKKGKLKDHRLLLAGSKGWKSNSLQKLIDRHKDDIKSLGYIADDAIPSLYRRADLFVFPSKYEGFGMPPREAMLCGAKVLVTDIPELKEATFGKATYVTDLSEDGLGNAILDTISSEKANVTEMAQTVASNDELPKLVPIIQRLTPKIRAINS